MRYVDNKVEGLQIAYIGGGSKGWAWKLMSDLAIQDDISGDVRLYDINFEAASNNETIGNNLSCRDEARSTWRYKAVRTIEEALTGADFVVISILPGTFQEMESDVHEPEKYGIYQSVGDTVGPGGLMRALRTVPMYVRIAEAIKQFSPKAWVINYTNPMTLCTRTLFEVFPDIKAFGCCHEIFDTQELLAEIVSGQMGLSNISRDDIKINVLGINHFTWIESATCKGVDLFPLYKEFVEKHYKSGYGKDLQMQMDGYSASAHRVKFDLFRRYGIIAAAGDRHLAEFCPPWYLKSPEVVAGWKFGLTPVSWRIEKKKQLDERAERIAAGLEQIPLRPTGEEGVQQMKALLGLGELLTNVNLPNQGQIAGIPTGAVVETNAWFTRDHIRPVSAGRLPLEVESLTMRHIYNQETVLRAAINRDREMAFRAFVNDPLVTISLEDARTLFDAMLQNTKEYLPGWDL